MMTKERPILFSGPMVRAILEGRKTQTRRVFKGSNFDLSLWMAGQANPTSNNPNVKVKCPYGKPGDRLWVRETWAGRRDHNFTIERSDPCYRADGDKRTSSHTPWKPSIHMPRWASRILLEIVSVRVERLQDITRADALAEGVMDGQSMAPIEMPDHADLEKRINPPLTINYIKGYERLWQSINGPESWAANPWVWVVEFKVLEVN